jgi:gliding motility-associated-like protein
MEQRGSVVLEGAVPAGVTNFTWMELADTPQAHELQPVVTPAADARYTLSVTDNNGCMATDEVLVKVTPLFNIPNTFSPNHDGVNDTWVINGLDAFPQARINVFNRYGAAVFASDHQPVLWDGSCQGKPLPWGTYYYTIDLQNGEKPLSGWVLILD